MKLNQQASGSSRREVLTAGMASAALLLVRPAQATPETMAAAIRRMTGERPVQPGRVRLEVPPLVENGNSVPVTVSVESPMTASDFVRTIALFNQKNPQPEVAVFHLGSRAGRASLSTRIRLADSQTVVAVAELSDGTLWSAQTDVIVTLAACVES